MSLALLPTSPRVILRGAQPFSASGGTEPYTFSVLPGGAGGSINASTGLYSAPAVSGSDTIQVIDDMGAKKTATITVLSVLQMFCDVLQTYLDLDDDQVYLWDQKINIPTDQRLYIAVAVLMVKPFGNTRLMVPSGGGLVEQNSGNFYAEVDVNILSRGPEARDRKEEVILALNSLYSQQQQQANGFLISTLSHSFLNLSEIDGAAIPYRFNIRVALQYQITKTQSADYYDTFLAPSVITDP